MDLVDFEDHIELFEPHRQGVFRDRLDPFNDYDDKDFLKRYRFTKNAVNDLRFLLEPDLRRKTGRSQSLSVDNQLFTALRFYGSGGPYQLLDGDSIGVSQPSVSRSITAVSTALCRRIDDYVKIPQGDYIQQCIRGFYEFAHFPGVIGCIDGTHIRIVAPSTNLEQFRNRKGYCSINVQVVCDHKLKFTNIVAKWPGSTHDSFILRQSNFWAHMEENRRQGIILGDSGYPCRYWLMTPYGNPVTEAQKNFNKAQKSTRVKIENAIGNWKRRFGLLHVESRRSLSDMLLDISACAVLHNLAKDWNMPDFLGDDGEEEILQTSHIDNEQRDNSGIQRRHTIANNHFGM